MKDEVLSLNSKMLKGVKTTEDVFDFKESTTEKFTKVHKSKNVWKWWEIVGLDR